MGKPLTPLSVPKGAPTPVAKAEPTTGMAAWDPRSGVLARGHLWGGGGRGAPAEEWLVRQGSGALSRAHESVPRRRNLV